MTAFRQRAVVTLLNPSNATQVLNEAARDGDVTRVIAWFDRAVAQATSDAADLYRAAVLLWDAYDRTRAQRGFDELARRGELDTTQRLQIARRHFEAGRFSDAAAMMEAVRSDQPRNPDILAMLAGCYDRGNDKDRARQIAEEAVAIDPRHARSVRLLAHLSRREDDFDSAIARLRDQLKQYTTADDWRLRYELAAALDRVGHHDEAMLELQHAKQALRPATWEALQESRRIRQAQRALMEAITRDDLALWRRRAAASPAQRMVYMTGFPRSGTTLLEQMLAAHPQCIGTDETGILRSQFIKPIVYDAPSTHDALNELRQFDGEAIAAGREVYLDCTESFLGEAIGSRMLIEKDPLLTADLPLAAALFPEAPVLMQLRDPRDVVISFYFTLTPLNWSSAPAISLAESCLFYADVMRHWFRWRDALQQPAITTRYEDLVADPPRELQRLGRELELPWDDAVLDVQRRAASHAIRTPTYDDVSRPIYRRSIARWRRYEKHLAPVMSVLEPFIEAFGYA